MRNVVQAPRCSIFFGGVLELQLLMLKLVQKCLSSKLDDNQDAILFVPETGKLVDLQCVW